MIDDKEFSRMEPDERRAALHFAADDFGIDSQEYEQLAQLHARLLCREMGQAFRKIGKEMISVFAEHRCAGFLLQRGPKGVEAIRCRLQEPWVI
jgi:hypothetical protein